MQLLELFNSIDNNQAKTDKGWICHTYIQNYYTQEFSPKKNEKLKILEIGVHMGVSIRLWGEYFQNSEILGLDINDYFRQDAAWWPYHIVNNIKFELCDAYDLFYINKIENNQFDYIIDDGPHTLESQLITTEYWYSKLKIGGKIIIEDIQSEENLQKLISLCEEKKLTYKVYDFRHSIKAYDDIILEITKN